MSDQHDAVQLRVASPWIAPRQPAESPGAQREYRGPAIDQSASARERSVELRQRFRQHGQLSDIRAAVEKTRVWRAAMSHRPPRCSFGSSTPVASATPTRGGTADPG